MNYRRWALVVCAAVVMALAGSASAQRGPSPEQPQAPAGPITTSFTYQGQVKKNGGAYTGACDFRIALWDAAAGGVQQGPTKTPTGVNVVNGLFTVELDFGDQFKGDARWLEIAVNCGDGAFTTMDPRILMTSSPYALSLRPGATISGTGTTGLVVNTPNGNPIVGYTQANGYAAIYGSESSSGGGYGIYGISGKGTGVYGLTNLGKAGVHGLNTNATAYSVGVWGQSDAFGTFGVYGSSAAGQAIRGASATGPAVVGTSTSGDGVRGQTTSGKSGVYGQNDNSTAYSTGVWGRSDAANTFGVYGSSAAGIGTWGQSTTGYGVVGVSTSGDGVRGQSTTGYAGYFIGKVGIQGGADLAELFDLSDQSEPGTLVVIDETSPGQLKASDQAYDTKVAGIVSGAGGVNPGLTLHQDGVLEGDTHVAIAGRVYVKATAQNGSIKPGDLLTTSELKGHAMKATDRNLAQGAVIGKALTALDSGTGLVLVLVNLQ